MPTSKWPKTVPILEADDICRQYLHGDNGRHCLAGWKLVVFGDARDQVYERLYEEAGVGAMNWIGLTRFNDTKPKAEVARVWNRAMARLGYVVGNPEAKHIK